MKSAPTILMLLTLSSFLLITVSWADEPTPERVIPELRASRINPEQPTIDGDLSDEVWHSAKLELARSFTQMQPDEGKAATESTVVAVVYDDDAVYFAFWNYDSEPDKIQTQLVRRDRYSDADLVSVRLDPYHDHLTGYRFELNACGVQRDMRLYDDVANDTEWDGVWEGAAKMQPWGWSAEMRIPYHCLRFADQEAQTWGCNVTRYISRRTESSWWAFSPSTEGGFVSRFGHLTGISGIKPARHLEVLPYAVSSLETEPKRLGNPDGRDYYKNLGFDVKYGISSNLTLDATVNPDFGQVELDQPVLNLSAFETMFSEKRPFFLEGMGMYSTPYSLFYSRRIGRSPSGSVAESRPYYYTEYPKATTILGAAKLTGKLSNGTSVGVLNAVTAEEQAEYVTYTVDSVTKQKIPQDTLSGMVEPQASYTVVRIQQDIFSGSNVGVMMTHVGQDGRYPATTGGADWRLATRNAAWVFSGQTVFSRRSNQKSGYAFYANIQKAAGKHVTGDISVNIKNPNLNLDRLGYTNRNDLRRTNAWLQYRTDTDWFIFRNTYQNGNLQLGWNYAGDIIYRDINYNTYIEFLNNWSFGGGISKGWPVYDKYETRGHGLWRSPSWWSVWMSVNTDSRRKVQVCLNPGWGKDGYANWWAHYTGITVRPTSNSEFSGGINFHRTFGARLWAYDSTAAPIFADLDRDEVSVDFSAGMVFRRNLSFQISAVGLISSLDYQAFRPYLGDGQYGEPVVRPRNLDGTYAALNTTTILRWEYLPGSTLYLVWTRAKSEMDNLVNNVDLSRDFDRFFSAGSTNVWLVKISYWWNI